MLIIQALVYVLSLRHSWRLYDIDQENFMRGLTIRSTFALSRVLLAVSDLEANDRKSMAIMSAESMGQLDFYKDLPPPLLFQDEPELLEAWEAGWDFSEELFAMSKCSDCNDGTGNPCVEHG